MTARLQAGAPLVVAAAVLCWGAYAAKPKATFKPAADLQWTGARVPGASTAAVEGNLAKGPSHFFLKYAPGFVSPSHHHTPDHFATLLTGTLVLTSDGTDHKLTPGSFRKLKSAVGSSVKSGSDGVYC